MGQQRSDRRAPTQSRPFVAAVSEIVDGAAAIGARASTQRRCCHAATLVARRLIAEEVLEAGTTWFDADERQLQVGDGVTDVIVRVVATDLDEHVAVIDPDLVAIRREALGKGVGLLVHLDDEGARVLGERAQGRCLEEPAGVDGDEVVADTLDLAQQVAGHDDGDAELVAGCAR